MRADFLVSLLLSAISSLSLAYVGVYCAIGQGSKRCVPSIASLVSLKRIVIARDPAGSSNGRTSPFGGEYLGSSPSPAGVRTINNGAL